ncbi:MAG: diaminopimelate epimerase, partial [Pseudomonadales bacterium]|nr:diaminopimelate epimerase [Pseudomonadales bacterium]
KMHGLGNDFMVLDLVTQEAELTPQQILSWADRHTGVGFDQLLLIAPPTDPQADFRYRIFNSDGTEAEQCGNGTRCVARLVKELNLCTRTEVRWQTSTGFLTTRLLEDGQVEVAMGVPSTETSLVPCHPPAAVARAAHPADSPGYVLENSAGERFDVVPVSMGNPHGVLFVPDAAAAPVADIGSALTSHPFFPARANIGFCEIVDPGFIRLRVFERGVGETRACGTGACAAVVAGRLTKGLRERVKVSLPGGKVRIQWQGPGSTVTMTGPATLVFHGRINFP